MAESPSWASAPTRPQNVNTLELVQQILQGRGPGSTAYQQRSMSSGRQPRLGTSTSVQGPLLTASTDAAGALNGGLDAGPAAHTRSPKQRSASVGRRQQDVQELASVVQELSTKGRVISSMSSILQELPAGSTIARTTNAGRSFGDNGAGASYASTGTAGGSGVGGVGPVALPDPRSYAGGGSSVSVTGGASVAGGSVIRGRSGTGSGSVSGKGIARSILGGVESLTSKLELLGDRLTPRKGSPRAERPREASAGRRQVASSSDGTGANFRDLLAAANLGLLQGHGLPDTAQGSRDQRPLSSAGAVGPASGAGGGSYSTASYTAGLRGGPGGGGSGSAAGGGMYGGAISTDLAASMILQNHHRRSEDLMAADLLLQNLHAEIRGASGGGAGSAAGASVPPSLHMQPAPPGQRPQNTTGGLHGLRGEGRGGDGGDTSNGRVNGGLDARGRPSRRRAGSAGPGNAEETGMLQSFLATLSEAVPPPQTPMVRTVSGAGPEAPMPPPAPAPPLQPQPANSSHTNTGVARETMLGRGEHQQRHQYIHPHRHHQHQQAHSGSLDSVAGSLGRASAPPPALPPPHPQPAPSQPHLLTERSTMGGASTASTSVPELGQELGHRLSELQRLTQAVTRGLAAPEAELSIDGSSGLMSGGGAALGAGGGSALSGVEAWLLSGGRSGRRESEQAAGPGGGTSYWRDGSSGGGGATGLNGLQSARLRTTWADDADAVTASTVGAVATGGAAVAAAAPAAGLSSARSDSRSGGAPGALRDLLPSGYQSLPLSVSVGPGAQAASSSALGSSAIQEPDGLHVALLMQQRRKERARREEQEVVEAAAAASRARQQASDWQAEHDKLMTKYLAVRQRLEALEAEQERVAREGCGSCARRRDQLQQVSDAAANAAAQLREVQAQLQEARAREEAVRRQLEHTATTASDQAAAGARQRTSFELALQEFIDLVDTATAATSLSGSVRGGAGGDTSSAASVAGVGGGNRSLGLGPGGGSSSGGPLDLECLLDTLRTRLREQGELARRQREMLDAAQERLVEERSTAAAARESASSERSGAVALAAQQASFQRERAEALQDELGRQREVTAKLEARVRQIEDERDRVVRQRDAAELSLQAHQAQLEAAQQQQDTLVGRLYDGQRAREDAEVLQGQIRTLTRLLDEARAGAARAEALERKAAAEREAREELDGQLSSLQSQLADKEAALDGARRRVRELETAANSAVASRQVAMDQVSTRSDEVRTLTSENARMFRHLDRLQQEKRAADAQIQDLAAQVSTLQQETVTLRADLAAAREQLAALRSSSSVMDATLAQHALSAELASVRSEAAALRAAHEAAGEYAQAMARTLRRHGLPVPEPPTAAEVASQIGALQAKVAAESDALAGARSEVTELRQQLGDARAEVERLKRELQSLTDRYSQLDAAHASSQQAWQHSAARDAAALQELTAEKDGLRLELHTLQVAGTQDGDELRRKMARLEVQVGTLAASKRDVEERARTLAADLGALRKALADKEAQVEAMRMRLDDAQMAAKDAAGLQREAEVQAAQAERARAAASAEVDKARAAAAAEAEKAQSMAASEAERAREAAEAEKLKAAEAAHAESDRAQREAERAREAAEARAEADRLRQEAEKAREATEAQAKESRMAAEAEAAKQKEEVARLQSEVERLEKELADRNAEYAGLYDYCAGVIGERDAAVEAREGFAAAATAAEEEVAALRREVEELREELADKEQRLAVKPKMAELQYRINELSAQLAEVTSERDAAVADRDQTAQKLQDETEAHFNTDGRRVRLGEEVERLRGILRMYSIPF